MDVHELIDKMANGLPVKKDFVDNLLKKMVVEIEKAVVKGEVVHIRGFGRFVSVKLAARSRRHPKTGVLMKLPATVTVKFRPSPTFRSKVAAKKPAVKP